MLLNVCTLAQMLFTLLMIMMSVAFFSLFERKMMSISQSRKGPNKVGLMGILQPISDAMKLISKMDSSPNLSSKFIYSLSPILFMLVSLLIWMSVPIKWNMLFVQTSTMMMILCFSLSVYGLISLGWFSNSKYATLGSSRSIAQSISYEIVMSFSIFSLMISTMSFGINEMVEFQEMVWFMFPFMGIMMILFITFLAEGNRSPFDLSEGESELVSGYCIEYGGASYTLIFLSENIYLMFMSYIFTIMFISGSAIMLKVSLIVFLLVWIRATMPRMRFDKMMLLCWVNLMPMSLSLITMYCMII